MREDERAERWVAGRMGLSLCIYILNHQEPLFIRDVQGALHTLAVCTFLAHSYFGKLGKATHKLLDDVNSGQHSSYTTQQQRRQVVLSLKQVRACKAQGIGVGTSIPRGICLPGESCVSQSCRIIAVASKYFYTPAVLSRMETEHGLVCKSSGVLVLPTGFQSCPEFATRVYVVEK